MDDASGNSLGDGGLPESPLHFSLTGPGSFDSFVNDLGSSISDKRGDRSHQSDSVKNLSANLRASLENAESTVKETLAIEEALKAEEVEKAGIEKQEVDFEMGQTRGRSM